MVENRATRKDLAKEAGHLLGHGAAVVAGMVLMITGMAMGVSVVLLPLGVPLGLAGLFVFLWGLFGTPQD